MVADRNNHGPDRPMPYGRPGYMSPTAASAGRSVSGTAGTSSLSGIHQTLGAPPTQGSQSESRRQYLMRELAALDEGGTQGPNAEQAGATAPPGAPDIPPQPINWLAGMMAPPRTEPATQPGVSFTPNAGHQFPTLMEPPQHVMPPYTLAAQPPVDIAAQVAAAVQAALGPIQVQLDELRGTQTAPFARQIPIAGPSSNSAGNIPPRGAYGECDVPSIRFSYIPVAIREAAMAGTLPPDSLHLLLPNTSFAFRPPRIEAADTAQTEDQQAANALRKFVAAIPHAGTFLHAWSIYVELRIWALGDAEARHHVLAALMTYGRWVSLTALTHEWTSVCHYHIAFTQARLGSSMVKDWVTADPNILPVLRQKSTHQPHGGNNADRTLADRITTPAGGAERALQPRQPAYGTSPVPCPDYNQGAGRCPYPCPHGRAHVCANCHMPNHTVQGCGAGRGRRVNSRR